MTDGKDESPVRRPIVVTAILLVAVALVLVLSRSWLEGLAEEGGGAAVPSAAAERDRSESVPEPETAVEVFDDVAMPVDAPVVAPATSIRIILLPQRIQNPDPDTEVFVDAVRQAMLRALRGMPNVEVVEVSATEFAAAVPANAGALSEDRVAYLALTRRYGGASIVEISERSSPESPLWMLSVIHHGRGTYTRSTDARKSGDPRPDKDPESIGVMFAEYVVRNAASPLSWNESTGDLSSIVFDSTRSDQERLQALSQLARNGPNSEMIAAAIELGARSASAETRRRAWELLRRNSYDRALAPPLSNALLSDADPAVRKEAALALAAYLDDVSTLPALEHALGNDSSADVRLAARMSMMSFDEQQVFKRETLLDRSLTPAERLAPETIDSGLISPANVRSAASEEEEVARSYAEIVAGTDDPVLKVRGLEALRMHNMSGRSTRLGPEIIDVLIASAGDEDGRVRLFAVNILTTQVENPEARAVLETLLREGPELPSQTRVWVERALRRPPQGTPPPR